MGGGACVVFVFKCFHHLCFMISENGSFHFLLVLDIAIKELKIPTVL